jgi:hypothetical protein
MGGLAVTLPIERIAGAAGAAQDLFSSLHEIVTREIHAAVCRDSHAQVTSYYLGASIEDGHGSERELWFGFRDSAGLCSMSMYACQHWFERVLALFASTHQLDAIAEGHGFRVLPGHPPLRSLLARCQTPLLELRGNLFAACTLEGAPHLVSDDLGEHTLSLERLTSSERAQLETALERERCDCDICSALRGTLT